MQKRIEDQIDIVRSKILEHKKVRSIISLIKDRFQTLDTKIEKVYKDQRKFQQDINQLMAQAQEERIKQTKESEYLRAKFDDNLTQTEEKMEIMSKQVAEVVEKTGSDFLNGQAKRLIAKATEEKIDLYKQTVNSDFKALKKYISDLETSIQNSDKEIQGHKRQIDILKSNY